MTDPVDVVLAFPSQKDWKRWLAKNHSKSSGIWLKFFKKDAGIASVTYDEALDEALCYGWIDGQLKKYDEKSYIQKFTPRRKKSLWSKRNKDHVARLISEGRMTQSGLKEIELAKADGRWDRGYDSPSNMKIPDDFLKEVSKNKKSKEFFDTLNRANKYSIAWRLQTATKPETRQKRMKAILEMLKEGKKFH
ncbi:MAG TPA: YdeI/OmpD-associated family protein [Acidobacteriota bacterium]|jgi:uncharacterized protein YdeI (YjbR/CyaY-like superfamily)|nr:YdeI/OmpD-associated family protein [Acidobacteriota bacterium]